MKLVTMKCPSCGANVDLDENQYTGFCKYCGTKVIVEESNVQKIKIENPVKIDGEIEVANNELKSKLAQAKNMANLFLRNNKVNYLEYIKVYNLYLEAEKIGAYESKVYLDMVNFFLEGNSHLINCAIENLKRNKSFGQIMFRKIKDYMQEYDICMESAITNAKNSSEKETLQKKYEENREKIMEKYSEQLDEYYKAKREANKKAWTIGIIVGGIVPIVLGTIVTLILELLL